MHENDQSYDSFSSSFLSDHPQHDEYVAVDHSPSPGVFGFEDPNRSYANSSPFGSINAENSNDYGAGESDGVFAADGHVLPPPADMVAKEGFAVDSWLRLSREEAERMWGSLELAMAGDGVKEGKKRGGGREA